MILSCPCLCPVSHGHCSISHRLKRVLSLIYPFAFLFFSLSSLLSFLNVLRINQKQQTPQWAVHHPSIHCILSTSTTTSLTHSTRHFLVDAVSVFPSLFQFPLSSFPFPFPVLLNQRIIYSGVHCCRFSLLSSGGGYLVVDAMQWLAVLRSLFCLIPQMSALCCSSRQC